MNCDKHPRNPSWWTDKRPCYECAKQFYATDMVKRELERKWDARYMDDRYDSIHHNDRKTSMTFPQDHAGYFNKWKGGK